VDTPGTRYMAAGMKILIGAVTAQISTVDSDTQVTLTATKTWSDNDVIKMSTADLTAASEMMGLGGIYDDGGRVGTLQNINRASAGNFFWKLPAASLNTTTAALSETNHMNPVYFSAKYYNQNSKKPRYVWIMAPTVFRAFGVLQTSYKKTVDLKEILSGGWKGLEYMNGIPVIDDEDCPDGEAYLVDLDALLWCTLTPLRFLPGGDGKGVLRAVPGTTLYEAIAAVYGNLGVNNVRSGGAMRNKS
jgi:hypothetical protein